MRFPLSFALLSTFAAWPVLAQDAIADHIGMLGLGYFSSRAPIGARLWTGQTFGAEAGIGFESDPDVPISRASGASTVDLHHFAFEGGILLALRSEANTIFFFRPGIAFERRQQVIGPTGDQRKASETAISMSGLLGLELFLSKLGFDNLSLAAGHGVSLTHTDPAGSGGSSTTFETVLAEVDVVRSSALGFHYYF